MPRLFSKVELEEALSKSLNKSEVAKSLNYSYYNLTVWKNIEKQIINYGLNISHFDTFKKLKNRRKYTVIEKTCPVCNSVFTTRLGEKREKTTCTRKCSNTFFKRHTDASKLKTSTALKDAADARGRLRIGRDAVELCCKHCTKTFTTLKLDRTFCSSSCAAKNSWSNTSYREAKMLALKLAVESGTHKGWNSRSKLAPSYAETYIENLLKYLSIQYSKEVKVGRWFVDFADTERMLALEIDGKQHLLPERRASDTLKDLYLIDNGWKVLRIPWRKIDFEFRKELIIKLTEFFHL